MGDYAVAIAGLVLTGLIFPFQLYFFKKNEKLHEDTRNKVSDHDRTLAVHAVKIESLELWRNMSTQPASTTVVSTHVQ